ncbi:MAG: CARDB domain-containing protein, partial [Syntrophorhabdaceae bacterium]|nr:CARDB domain-containing protein [Syntrophorhabdaceae bacterium]
LKKGEHRYFSRSVTFQDEGEASFRADVDLNNDVTETNENNNRVVGKIIHRAVQDPAVTVEIICSDGKKRQF